MTKKDKKRPQVPVYESPRQENCGHEQMTEVEFEPLKFYWFDPFISEIRALIAMKQFYLSTTDLSWI